MSLLEQAIASALESSDSTTPAFSSSPRRRPKRACYVCGTPTMEMVCSSGPEVRWCVPCCNDCNAWLLRSRP